MLTEVSQVSSFQAMPQEGHLEACYSIFAYLRKHQSMSLVFHPSCINIRQDHFKSQDWMDFYGDGVEELLPDMLEPLGETIKVTAFIDSNHAGNLVTQQSQTAYILFCNQAPITWYSKKQNTVEASTFGAESIAACTCLEAIESLCLKLRMFGIPVDGPTNVLCDNNSVVNNSQRPESVLSKKHLSICFHWVQEGVVDQVIWVGKIESQCNVADCFTKCLPTPTCAYLLGGIVANSHDGLCPVDQDDSRLNCTFEQGRFPVAHGKNGTSCHGPLKQVWPRHH